MTSEAQSETPRLAGRSGVAIARFVLVAIAVFAADLVIKHYAFAHVAGMPVTVDEGELLSHAHIPDHHAVTLVPKVLALKLTANEGAVFGIAQGGRLVFIAVSVLAVAVIGTIFVRSGARMWGLHTALALVLAGAMGNLYDRMAFGAVRDMFWLFPEVKLPFGWTWPGGSDDAYPWIFNLADVALLGGIAILMVVMYIGHRREQREAKKKDRGGAADAEHAQRKKKQ